MNSSGTYTISFTPMQSSVQLSIAYSYFKKNANTLCFTLDSVNYQQQSASVSSTQLVQVSNKINDGYRYGFGGIEKVNEIKGEGNHYTVLFGEYDSRLGRRWNQDPKPNPSISNYAMFGNSPIWFSDPLLDTVKSTQEGFNFMNEGLISTLGKDHGFSYDKENGILNYKATEGKTYSKDQQDIINRYTTLINSDKNTNVNIVNHDEKINIIGKSLADMGFNAVTAASSDFSSFNVFIARNPQENGMVANPKFNPMRPNGQPEEIPGYVNTSLLYRGVASIHEIGVHAYLRLTQPLLTQPNHNTLVESFETTFRQFYQIGAYDSKRDVKRANKSGLGVKLGDTKFLGGSASKH
jgi:hypothetical protein